MAEGQLASATPQTTTEPAPAPVAKPGPGAEALRAMLAAGTRPDPKVVIELLDTHRGERDAIFALLHQSLGNAYVQEVVAGMDGLRASVKHREVAAGDPSDPNSGYFVAGQAENGARWRTADGSFTGKAGKDGLDTRYQMSERDALHGQVDKGGTGRLAYEHDGKEQGELYGRAKGSKDWEAGIRRTDEVGGGSLTYGARHQVTANGASDGLSAEYKAAGGATTVGGSAGVQDGHAVGDLHGSHKFDGGQTVTGSATVAQTPQGQVETVSGAYADPKTKVNGSVSHHADGAFTGNLTGSHQLDAQTSLNGSVVRGQDRTTYAASATEQVTPQLQLGQSLTHVDPDHGKSQTTLGLTDRYRSGSMVQGLDLNLGKGERDYLSATGSMDAQLGHHLYGGAWGTYTKEGGKQDVASVGASLTFTPTEKTALTLAGIVDQSGALETRLQFDVFKQRIENVGDLSAHKKDALVSLFLSYSQGGQSGNKGMLDERFGAPQQSYGRGAGEGQVMAGIRIKF
ncbi:MAG: hypothetical protein IPQ07_06700 [Myxococcales bacterium]|nr:hypothetical protein [Myxococcales bacterium]